MPQYACIHTCIDERVGGRASSNTVKIMTILCQAFYPVRTSTLCYCSCVLFLFFWAKARVNVSLLNEASCFFDNFANIYDTFLKYSFGLL